MSDADHEFWTCGHKYEDLAREFERNIELKHPYRVDSRGMCVCLKWTHGCGWATTSVKYPTYTGPRVTHL